MRIAFRNPSGQWLSIADDDEDEDEQARSQTIVHPIDRSRLSKRRLRLMPWMPQQRGAIALQPDTILLLATGIRRDSVARTPPHGAFAQRARLAIRNDFAAIR
jgi:hypothetical protein